MGKFVEPKAYLVGYTDVHVEGLKQYLKDTNQEDFLETWDAAMKSGVSPGEALCSFYAKICYASLVLEKNKNITRVRDIPDNIRGTFDSGHGCYDAETDVLTSAGWRTWPDVTKDDFLATLVGGNLVYHKPISVQSFNHVGRMFRVESQGVDLLVTDNHMMYVCPTTTKAGRKKHDYSLMTPDQIDVSSHAYLKTIPGFFLPQAKEPPLSDDKMRLLGFAIGDGHYSGSGLRLRFRLRRMRKIVWLNNLVMRLQAAEEEGQWGLNQHDDRFDMEFPARMREWLERIYDQYGDKCIPQSLLMTGTHRGLSALLEGLLTSEGHAGETGDSFDTTSETLVGQVQQLCLHVRLAANIVYTYGKDERLTSYGSKPLTRLSILSRNLRPEVNKCGGEGRTYWIDKWAGEVFCAQMADDTQHVLYVRRNGKPVWCGNSVFEHASMNFIITNCSRVFTHELVRHRVGTAFSQTSGRYVRGDEINLVMDPILIPVHNDISVAMSALEVEYRHWCDRMGLNGYAKLRESLAKEESPGKWKHPTEEESSYEARCLGMVQRDGEWKLPDDHKKRVTSALRRALPNGQSNEIGLTMNIRAARHTVQMRTAGGAEWEIRKVFAQIYDMLKYKFPLMFHGAKETKVRGITEVSGMRMAPYELKAGDPGALVFYSSDVLATELDRRTAAKE